jgi:hypothetical protein
VVAEDADGGHHPDARDDPTAEPADETEGYDGCDKYRHKMQSVWP